MDSVKVEGQTIKQTYELVADVVGEPMIASLQCDFSLCEADYLRLTTRGSKLGDASIAVLLLSVGFGISVIAKQVASWWSGTGSTVEKWEYWAVGIGLVVAASLAGISRLLPNARRELLKTMKEYFESHPRQRRVMRRVNER